MKNVLIIFSLLFSLTSCAQSNKVKIYAYQQQVLPGVRAITIDESGVTKEIPNRMPPKLFMYVELLPGYKKTIEPMHVWINGKAFALKNSTPTLPVVIYNSSIPSKAPDTLMRPTENPVLQLEPVSKDIQFNPSSTAKKKMKTHELVLHTLENGKNCYYYVQHIKVLDPVALQ